MVARKAWKTKCQFSILECLEISGLTGPFLGYRRILRLCMTLRGLLERAPQFRLLHAGMAPTRIPQYAPHGHQSWLVALAGIYWRRLPLEIFADTRTARSQSPIFGDSNSHGSKVPLHRLNMIGPKVSDFPPQSQTIGQSRRP